MLSPRALELLWVVFGPQSNTNFPGGVAGEIVEIRQFVQTQGQAQKASAQVEAQAPPVRRGRRPGPQAEPPKD